MNLKTLISNVNSWNDFKNLLETKTKLEKGKAFEELTKYYLQYNPIYKSQLKNVWLQNEITPSLLKKLNIPTNDQGIDLVAETFEGTYWAIQCKYLQDEEQRLSHRAISTFVSLSRGIAENITYCLVCTTVDDYAKIYQGKENIGFCNSDEWRKLDKEFFDWLRSKIAGKEKKLIPYSPKPHQIKALKEARQYFTKENNSRGKLVFPCGAGKSLTGYWITRELKAKSVIVAVPSLSLVKQTLEVYLRESVANNEKVEWLCVCSDEGIGKNDDIVIHTNEIGVPCVTNKTVISDWLIKNKQRKTIIFTTYQSGKTIAEACKMAKHSFNLGIMDEAHKTVGEQDKLFSHLLFDKNIKIEQRIFMTATERRYAGASDTILSMDDANVYGETFAQMSFKHAIEIGILSDYKIITLFISNEEVRKLIEQNAFVKPSGKDWDKETEARTLAALIALRKAMTKFPIHHAVTFHSSIKKAVAFEQSQSHFSAAYPKFSKVKSYHVSGTMPTSVRGKIVDEFAATKKGIITNAKCLTEGIDVPNIDCVLFADPRKSTVDIVQAVGRALRTKEGKKFGYVILPVFTNSTNTAEIIESAEFKEILSTIRALASNDERIIEYFRDVSKGVKKNNADKLIQFDIDEQIAEHINIQELTGALQLKTWDKLAKLSWMPFEEAREFVRNLKLKSNNDWNKFSKLKIRPLDIPITPDRIYKSLGWISWGDFLGTNFVATNLRDYLSYEEASILAQKMNLTNSKEWITLSQSPSFYNKIPKQPFKVYEKTGWKDWSTFLGVVKNKYLDYDEAKKILFIKKIKTTHQFWINFRLGELPRIPKNPAVFYKFKGWNGWSDFLGAPNQIDSKYLPYKDVQRIVKKYKIGTVKGWKDLLKRKIIKGGLPSHPNTAYKGKGWISWADFFGTSNFRKVEYLSFDKARTLIQKARLKNNTEWRMYSKTLRPKYIPGNPSKIYKNDGWVSWSDFLGNNNERNIDFLPFETAREIVRKNKLKSNKDWREYSKSKRPKNIPTNPDKQYATQGWKDWGNFLGSGVISNQEKEFLKIDDAKKEIKKFNLYNVKDWQKFCQSGNKPQGIPRNPYQHYSDKGWKGWCDFLSIPFGYKKENDKYLDYNSAKKSVINLKIDTQVQWNEYCKSGKKQANIPRNPNTVYKNDWNGWGDWLGTGRKATKDRVYWDFQKARLFVQNLKLKNEAEWRIYTKTEKMNLNIPVSPSTVYTNSGWISMGDWLGTGFVAHKLKEFLSFEIAKKKVVKLRLQGLQEWRQYCISGEKPNNIPSNPEKIYKESGWVGYGDWLGTGNMAAGSIIYLGFVQARKFTRNLKLNSRKKWEDYCNSGKKPNNIPKTPNYIYESKGWKGWADFLGKETKK